MLCYAGTRGGNKGTLWSSTKPKFIPMGTISGQQRKNFFAFYISKNGGIVANISRFQMMGDPVPGLSGYFFFFFFIYPPAISPASLVRILFVYFTSVRRLALKNVKNEGVKY